ncbi:sensor histidine kinase [Rummeliibacillus suwonensis]|uniref:sensor histidine kinase n=1 Tax=Rummeliibacillus suwonensis TaxID=1306154 RepID=UPI001AB01C0D|nr:GHKL domain-containing protein [Rummeliibacillus suwonensis]MBO2535777.1 GHKL domain-containing protein [Rummeliibacillus suwonensis]
MNHFFSSVIEFCAIFFALVYTLRIRINFRIVLIFIAIVVLPTISVYLFVTSWLGILLLFFTTMLFFYWVSRDFRALLDICIIFFSGVVADHLAELINIYLTSSINILFYVFFIIFFTLFIYIYKNIIIDKVLARIDIPLLIQISIFLIVSATILVFYLNIFVPDNRDEIELVKINLAIQLSYFLLMLLLFGLLLYGIKKENRLKQRAIEMEQFSMYVEGLEQINRDMQKFRHDYANILLTMQGYLDDNNLEDLKEYFQQHILKVESNTLFKNKVLANLDNLKITGLKGLIATKALQANEQEIDVSIEIPDKIDNIHMNIIDLTRMIGILIDNAIEANQSVDHKIMNIAFFKTNTGSLIIIIRNTMEEQILNVTDIYKESFSTKGKGRGFGLANVKQIVERYPQVTMNTRIEDNWFIQEIEIQNWGQIN